MSAEGSFNNKSPQYGRYLCSWDIETTRSRFLFQDELIIHTGLIWKKKGLFSKKRQLILTDRPRLFYVDPDQMEIKGEIPWSRSLLVEVKSNRKFNIVVVSVHRKKRIAYS